MIFLKKHFLLPLVFMLCLIGCRKTENSPAANPRTISLSPAVTKIIFQMGLQEHLVGVTSFCDIPEGMNIPRVGDTKSLNNEQILSLKPDIIMGQMDKRHIEGIKQFKPDLKIVEIKIESLDDIMPSAAKIAELLENPQAASEQRNLFNKIENEIRAKTRSIKPKRVLFVMGTNTPTVAAKGSFIHDMIELSGGINVGDEISGSPRWRDVTIESIHKAQPDVIICQMFSPEEKVNAEKFWRQWKSLPAVENNKVFVVDDPDWTIPSLKIIEYCEKLFDFIHG